MGIYFGSNTSEKLDTYDEGTWTPNFRSINGGTMSYTTNMNDGRYVRIGNMVTLSFKGVQSHSGSNGPVIFSCPFTPQNYNGSQQFSCCMTDNMDSGSSAAFWGIYVSQNNATGYLFYITKNQGWTYQETGHDNNFGIIGSITYECV